MSEKKNLEVQYNDYGDIIDVDAVEGPVVSTFLKFVMLFQRKLYFLKNYNLRISRKADDLLD